MYRTAHSLKDDTNIKSNSAPRKRELWRNQSRLSPATSGRSRKRHGVLHQSANHKAQYSRHQLHTKLRGELTSPVNTPSSQLDSGGDARSNHATLRHSLTLSHTNISRLPPPTHGNSLCGCRSVTTARNTGSFLSAITIVRHFRPLPRQAWVG